MTSAPADLGPGPALARSASWMRAWAPWLAPLALLAFLRWRPATTGPTICPFALVTGHACPLCGGTRAAAAAIQGEWAAAWDLHPLVFVVLPVMATAWVWWLGVSRGWWQPMNPRNVNRLWATAGVVFLTVWLVRVTTGTLPPV